MQKIRQILLFLERGFSQRSIERETGINRRTIASYLQRFADSGFSIAELLLFSDAELEAYLNAGKAEQIEKDPRRIHLESQFSYLFSELRRVGVTRQLLWQEYINEYPDGFGYSVSTLWSTSMNNLMLFLALVDEQRRKKSPDVCYDSRLAAERPEQETLLRGKWHQ